MQSKTTQQLNSCKKPSDTRLEFEAKQNLLGFFDLLLRVDRRNNPKRYQNNEDNRDTNSPN